jgi:hypothetical protein
LPGMRRPSVADPRIPALNSSRVRTPFLARGRACHVRDVLLPDQTSIPRSQEATSPEGREAIPPSHPRQRSPYRHGDPADDPHRYSVGLRTPLANGEADSHPHFARAGRPSRTLARSRPRRGRPGHALGPIARPPPVPDTRDGTGPTPAIDEGTPCRAPPHRRRRRPSCSAS